jgi:dihydroorotate dehydrogenase (NAD+) catalytic subunit
MLSVTVAGLSFPTPVLNASGAFNPTLFSRLFDFPTTLGGIVTKTVTREPWVGNPQYRTVELPGVGMLNSIGLQNPGLQYFLDEEAPVLKAHGIPLFLSISASSNSEFALMAQTVAQHPNGYCVDALELNLSCPNVEKGGVHFGSNPESVLGAVSAVKAVWSRPVFAKLTPNVTDIVSIAASAIEGGADGLTAINTVLGASIDIKKKKPVLKRVSGGYSGPGIKPIALHAVWQLHQHFPTTPIMAVGGLSNANDVLEFLMAGASLVQVGTACFRQPMVFPRIIEQLRQYGQDEGLASIHELVGCAHPRAQAAAHPLEKA